MCNAAQQLSALGTTIVVSQPTMLHTMRLFSVVWEFRPHLVILVLTAKATSAALLSAQHTQVLEVSCWDL